MKTLQANESKTVGINKGYHTKPTFIGEFNPVLLKEWIELVLKQLGDEPPVYLCFYGSYDPNVSNVVLAASEEAWHPDSDGVHVDVVGVDCDDVKGR